MTKFAFIIHPISVADVHKKLPFTRFLPERAIETFLHYKKPVVASEIKGIRSKTGATTEGIFIGLPMTPAMFGRHSVASTYDRLQECVELAEREGAKVIGLGAYTSVVGDGGLTLAKRSRIGITTGNSYTVATAIEGTLKACSLLGIIPSASTLAVVGATGSIGRTCGVLLGQQFGKTILVGRDLERTEEVTRDVERSMATTDLSKLLQADVVVTVTSSETDVVEPQHLKHGAIVCDVARPRDVSIRVQKERPDILVIEGGVVQVPGDVDFGFDFGFPPGMAYACMSETIMLALEDNPISFTLGKSVGVDQVQQTWTWAERHGFKLAGFRSFEREVDEETIDRVKRLRARPATA